MTSLDDANHHHRRHGTWGPFLRAFGTGIYDRATMGIHHPDTTGASMMNDHHHSPSSRPSSSSQHYYNMSNDNADKHCSWCSFFQAFQSGIKEDALTIKRRLTTPPRVQHQAIPPFAPPTSNSPPSSPVFQRTAVGTPPSSPSQEATTPPPVDWDHLQVDVRVVSTDGLLGWLAFLDPSHSLALPSSFPSSHRNLENRGPCHRPGRKKGSIMSRIPE